ncbi:type 1 glutamine amidotransferase [Lewinella marina]|uniref:ThuA domain-containing protein n=1 Tax=Neolewinella marina TaxID=438751 RepID=UPI00142F6141|nr:ThuA domain-containing protein [Neolewinella marina]NJB84975.1 type 1 glutamine amidotransferase [Neolewinella marina]
MQLLSRSFLVLSILFFPLAWAAAQAGDWPSFTVHSGPYARQQTLVCAEVDEAVGARHDALALYEVTGGSNRRPVTVQWEGNRLCWVLEGETPAGTQRRYALALAASGGGSTPAGGIQATLADGRVRFVAGDDRTLLTYQRDPAPVPAGVDPIFSRGGFLHPILSPAGDTLTRIQPSDHYHHYGVWNPWTHTEYQGRELDFWNLVRGHGTVTADGVDNLAGGPLTAGLTARHTYLMFPDSAVREGAKPLLEEQLDLGVHSLDRNAYQVDYTTTQRNITDEPFVVKAYRYQGIGFRARPDWDDATARLLTSGGKNKADGNATRARWMMVDGPTNSGRSGILFLSHPDNYDAPQTIRIWPEGANGGKENVFLNFNPAQEVDFRLRPDGQYRLKYRMVVYNGTLDSAAAERYWQDFAHPPRVVVDGAGKLQGKRVLVYTRNGKGYVHENIPASVAAIERLGEENGFSVVSSDDPAYFTPERLADFDVLVFSNTNNDIFETPAQHEAFRGYLEGGGGYVGIHSAIGSERDWPYFWRVIGGTFHRHPKRQDFDVAVIDPDHPSTDFLPPTWHIRDEECYYIKKLNPAMHVLLAADLSTVDDPEGKAGYPGETFGNSFPASWYLTNHGGRQWYTALGHRSEHYSDPLFIRHILGGIEWAAR